METPVFVEQLAELAGQAQMELLYAIQDDLLLNAERGALEGKSGGFRYLYLYLELRGRIHLLYLYSQREQADLSEAERKQLAALVDILKRAGKKQ